MSHDDDLRELLTGAAHAPRPAFRDELRRRLDDEWHGRPAVLAVAGPDRPRRRLVPLLAVAAATVALVVALGWAVGRPDGAPTPPAVTGPPGSTLPAPGPTVTGPTPTAPLDPGQPGAVDPPPVTTARPPETPTSTTVGAAAAGCLPGLDAAAAVDAFFAGLVRARETGATERLTACLGDVERLIAESPATCWDGGCASARTFARGGVHVGEVGDPEHGTYWVAGLPVSYLEGPSWTVRDTVERWRFTPDGDAWSVALESVDDPFVSRDEATAAINEFQAALAAGDWTTAAELLGQGGQSPDERDDIARLAPADFTVEGIAAALARWCEPGCDTALAAAEELRFDGGHALVRNGQVLRASWFEGHHGVSGGPILRSTPRRGADLLAEFPAPPSAAPALPYLVPGVDVDGEPRRSEFREPHDAPVHQQLWVDPTDPGRSVYVTTAPGRSPFFQNTRPVDVGDWDDARASWTARGYQNLTLAEPGGVVHVHTRGIDEWTALDLAAGLTRRADGTGWDLAAEGFAPLGEAWWVELGGWTIHWPGAELSVGAGLELLGNTVDGAAGLVDVGGGLTGWLHDDGNRVTIAWTAAPGVTARFGYLGSGDAALAVVRSLTEVDRATWEAFAPPDTSGDDGCRGLFC